MRLISSVKAVAAVLRIAVRERPGSEAAATLSAGYGRWFELGEGIGVSDTFGNT
jgi:hypothetical protein